jgi:hypothetical protein
MGGKRSVCRVWWKTRRNETTRRHRHRWKDNTKMDLREIGCWVLDWIFLAQDKDQWRALVNTVMNLLVP